MSLSNIINISNTIHILVICAPRVVSSPFTYSSPQLLQVYSHRHHFQQPPSDSIQVSTIVSPPTSTTESDFSVALRKNRRFYM